MNQLSFLPPEAFKLRRPSEPILRSAIIEGEFRFELRRQWGSGPCIMWAGLNPSTADGKTDDPTMWREMSFSRAWGFGSLIKVNAYPFRTSSPQRLRTWLGARHVDRAVQAAIGRNLSFIRTAVEECDAYVAAWGAGVDKDDARAIMDRLIDFNRAEEDDGPVRVWQCLGTNADGSPKHTLARGRHRVPDDQKLIPWERRP